jgi:hypothetical protein
VVSNTQRTESDTKRPPVPCVVAFLSVQMEQHAHTKTQACAVVTCFPSTTSSAHERGCNTCIFNDVAFLSSCQNKRAQVHSKKAWKIDSSAAPHILHIASSSMCLLLRICRHGTYSLTTIHQNDLIFGGTSNSQSNFQH